MSIRHVRVDHHAHCACSDIRRPSCQGVTPATLCLAHRCTEHASIPPVNRAGPEDSECGICIGDALANAYADTFETEVFWPTLESAKARLNMLAPGAGDKLVEEARALLQAQGQSLGRSN